MERPYFTKRDRAMVAFFIDCLDAEATYAKFKGLTPSRLKNLLHVALDAACAHGVSEDQAELTPPPAPSRNGTVTMHFDGASRGNPGDASGAFVLLRADGTVLAEGGKYLGKRTNNVAEYAGLYLGLKKALEEGVQKIRVFGDSKLIVNQIKGLWKVKDEGMKKAYAETIALVRQFPDFQITHLLREKNKRADELANLAIDEHKSKK